MKFGTARETLICAECSVHYRLSRNAEDKEDKRSSGSTSTLPVSIARLEVILTRYSVDYYKSIFFANTSQFNLRFPHCLKLFSNVN